MGGKSITISGSDHFPIILESLQPLHEDRLPHWKINKANWQVFETMCKQKLLKDPNIIDQTKHFTETLISIANETIVKTSASNKHSTPWFNDDCRRAIRLRMAALRKFNKEPTTNNFNAFKLLRAKTRKDYVNQLGSSTRTNTIWTMMRKISRKNQPTALKHFTKNKTEETTKKDIADTLAVTFSANSSINNSNSHFLTFKNNAEKENLNFKSYNSEKYNQPNYEELSIHHTTQQPARMKSIMNF